LKITKEKRRKQIGGKRVKESRKKAHGKLLGEVCKNPKKPKKPKEEMGVRPQGAEAQKNQRYGSIVKQEEEKVISKKKEAEQEGRSALRWPKRKPEKEGWKGGGNHVNAERTGISKKKMTEKKRKTSWRGSRFGLHGRNGVEVPHGDEVFQLGSAGHDFQQRKKTQGWVP